MKRADLEALGIEKENIDKIMTMNGDDINAIKKEKTDLQERLDTATTQLKDAQGKLKDVDSKDETIKDLQKQIEDFNEAEKQRKEAEEAATKERELTERITAVFPEDKEFTSDYVRNGIISDIKKKMAEDNTLGAKEIFETLTKDQEGIFKNPQHEKLEIGGVDGNGDDDKPVFKNFF